MKHTTPWNKIKAEYLQGVTPKELATKYHLKAKQISDKANEEKWVAEKAKISENLRSDVQNRIKEMTNVALEALCDVINDPECKNTDKVSAARAILDVSGLKSLKQEVSGVKGINIVVADEHHKEMLEEL